MRFPGRPSRTSPLAGATGMRAFGIIGRRRNGESSPSRTTRNGRRGRFASTGSGGPLRGPTDDPRPARFNRPRRPPRGHQLGSHGASAEPIAPTAPRSSSGEPTLEGAGEGALQRLDRRATDALTGAGRAPHGKRRTGAAAVTGSHDTSVSLTRTRSTDVERRVQARRRAASALWMGRIARRALAPDIGTSRKQPDRITTRAAPTGRKPDQRPIAGADHVENGLHAPWRVQT